MTAPLDARPHITVLRAASALRLIPPGDPLLVKVATPHDGPGYMRISAVPHPAESHLRFEAAGFVRDLVEAQDVLGSTASRFAGGLSLAAHAGIGVLDLTACYCSDANAGSRPFVRDHIVHPAGGSIAPRDIEGDLAATVCAALWDAGERVERAVWHFSHALRVWEPRLLAPAAAHLWIAAETMGPIAEKASIDAEGVADWKALAQRWNLSAEYDGQLHGMVTNRAIGEVIFNGDHELAGDLRSFSNGWEHGYQSFGTLGAEADRLVTGAAAAVRKGILSRLVPSGPATDRLLADLYDTAVGLWSPAVRFAGDLDGPPEVFAPLAAPVEPDTKVEISSAPSDVGWRELTWTTTMGAGGGHPDGVLINVKEHSVVAPSGRPQHAASPSREP